MPQSYSPGGDSLQRGRVCLELAWLLPMSRHTSTSESRDALPFSLVDRSGDVVTLPGVVSGPVRRLSLSRQRCPLRGPHSRQRHAPRNGLRAGAGRLPARGLPTGTLRRASGMPAPADPTTTVRRLAAPAVSRSCIADLVTSVPGNAVGRNFASANRKLCEASFPVAAAGTMPPPRSLP
jgi:hypothetical protein